jgi:hypothetical protein
VGPLNQSESESEHYHSDSLHSLSLFLILIQYGVNGDMHIQDREHHSVFLFFVETSIIAVHSLLNHNILYQETILLI